MNIVRKISIGENLKDSMHYQVGGFVMNKTKKISDIIKRDKFFDIYVCEDDDNVKYLWKTFSELVVGHVEYETNF